MPPDEEKEVTLLQASIHFGMDSEDLYLALEALEAHREPNPNYVSGAGGLYRRAKYSRGSVETYYLLKDCEAALALLAAKAPGFDDG